MTEKTVAILENLLVRYPSLRECREEIVSAYETLVECFASGGKLLIAGNGGSAADAEHMVGELMKSFVKRRPVSPALKEALVAADPEAGAELADTLQGALPAIALDGHPALGTAWINDCNPLMGFAQQVLGYGKSGDVLIAVSTSGTSRNVLHAVTVAKALGLRTVGLTGRSGGELALRCDVCIRVPESETYKVQELHLPVYHAICQMLEERFF